MATRSLRRSVVALLIVACVGYSAASGEAQTIQLPGGVLTVSGTSSTGASFVYSGTLTHNDTIAFTQTGNPCLQVSNGYCVNGAGVLTVAATVGFTPVGGSGSFSGPSGIIPAGTWTYGALLMSVSGVGTVQVFPTNASNGLGSPSPPASLTLPVTSLSALGFTAFSQANPTITFTVTDTNFTDNSNQFLLTQGAGVPTLSEGAMLVFAVVLAAVAVVRLTRRRMTTA